MLNISLKSRTLGVLMIIPSILMLFWVVISSGFMTLWGFGHGVGISRMMPFILLSILKLLLVVFACYASIRYIKNKPLRQNKTLGIIFIIVGILFFIYESSVHFDITGINPEGEARAVLAFVWGLILLLLGMGLINCKEEQSKKPASM